MIPLAPLLINGIAHQHAGDAASRQKDASMPSDRLGAAAAMSTDDIDPDDMKKLIVQMMLNAFKEQVLTPDPDDPGSCATLDANASW